MLLHGDLPLEWAGLATVAVGIKVAGVVYARGWRRYRLRLPGRFAGPQLAAFLGGLACLCAAILPPVDEAADARLSAHMVQHILLLTLAPALLLLGDPLLPLLRGLPDSLRRSLVAPLLRGRRLRRAVHALVHPVVGLLFSSVILWSWHVPGLYQLALRVPAIHLIEHGSFFAGGLLFWFPVVQPWPSRPRWPTGAMIPYLLAADVQNTVLAALLTFSDRVLYPFYEFHSRATAAAALDDQVLAGVIMWVPMSLAYLIPAALLTIRLLSPATREAFGRPALRPRPVGTEPRSLADRGPARGRPDDALLAEPDCRLTLGLDHRDAEATIVERGHLVETIVTAAGCPACPPGRRRSYGAARSGSHSCLPVVQAAASAREARSNVG